MILPIVAYGAQILRKVSASIDASYPSLPKLLEDMWETMYYSNGVGLAAPQINRDIRLFVVDSKQIFENLDDEEKAEYPGDAGIKQVFINAHIKTLNGDDWPYNEGCLSIPKIREDVFRPEEVTLDYVDENFQPQSTTFTGITARVILHEYDHIEGILFTDKISMLKKTLIKKKLQNIMDGKARPDYRMKFANKKGR